MLSAKRDVVAAKRFFREADASRTQANFVVSFFQITV